MVVLACLAVLQVKEIFSLDLVVFHVLTIAPMISRCMSTY